MPLSLQPQRLTRLSLPYQYSLNSLRQQARMPLLSIDGDFFPGCDLMCTCVLVLVSKLSNKPRSSFCGFSMCLLEAGWVSPKTKKNMYIYIYMYIIYLYYYIIYKYIILYNILYYIKLYYILYLYIIFYIIYYILYIIHYII